MATAPEAPNPTSTPSPASPPIAPPAPAAANAPIDSASKVNKPPAAPPSFPLATKPGPGQSAQGWWSVRGIKGARADVVKAVQAMPEIPAHWQAALAAEITNHNAATGKLVLYVDISPLEGFVGDGAVTVDAHFVKQNPKGSPKGPASKRS